MERGRPKGDLAKPNTELITRIYAVLDENGVMSRLAIAKVLQKNVGSIDCASRYMYDVYEDDKGNWHRIRSAK